MLYNGNYLQKKTFANDPQFPHSRENICDLLHEVIEMDAHRHSILTCGIDC